MSGHLVLRAFYAVVVESRMAVSSRQEHRITCRASRERAAVNRAGAAHPSWETSDGAGRDASASAAPPLEVLCYPRELGANRLPACV